MVEVARYVRIWGQAGRLQDNASRQRFRKDGLHCCRLCMYHEECTSTLLRYPRSEIVDFVSWKYSSHDNRETAEARVASASFADCITDSFYIVVLLFHSLENIVSFSALTSNSWVQVLLG